MLIRSQDKKSLINLNNVTRLTAGKIYGNEPGWIIEVDKLPFTECLGQYATEEKAIKVLDHIKDYYINAINSRCRYYQMPQDSEVDI